MWTCKHCLKNFSFSSVSEKANHSRWCTSNPKRKQYEKNLEKARDSRTMFKNQYSYGAICSEATKDKLSKIFTGRKHTKETIQLIREKALNSDHRRLLRSTRKYIKLDGTTVLLDSSWEEKLAKRLDFLKITWIRPSIPINYTTTDGKTHKYFPDFYLPDYDIYLDPKNPAAKSAQKEKLEILNKQMKNLIILESEEECINFAVVAQGEQGVL